MKAYDAHAHLMNNHIIEQLNGFNYYETEGKSQRELIMELAKQRAMEVEVNSPHAGWF